MRRLRRRTEASISSARTAAMNSPGTSRRPCDARWDVLDFGGRTEVDPRSKRTVRRSSAGFRIRAGTPVQDVRMSTVVVVGRSRLNGFTSAPSAAPPPAPASTPSSSRGTSSSRWWGALAPAFSPAVFRRSWTGLEVPPCWLAYLARRRGGRAFSSSGECSRPGQAAPDAADARTNL